MTTQNNLLNEKLDHIQNQINPLKKKLDELEEILKKNYENNRDLYILQGICAFYRSFVH